MSVTLQLAIVFGYLFVVLAVGVLAYRVTERTAEDYYLAGRSFGTVILLFTLFATLLSAFTFFGGPDGAYQHGPEWLLIMGVMNGVIFAILWYLIGYRQWQLGRRHGYVTLGELLGDRFGSPRLRGLVAGLSLLWLFPYVMLQQIGAGGALVGLTGGAVPFWAGATAITGFMIAYVLLAGIRGIAWTDTIQGVLMLGAVWTALGWILATGPGLAAINESIARTEPAFLGLGSEFYTPGRMLTLAISIGAGATMFPQINQRFFTAGSKRVLQRAFVLWPMLVLLLFVPAFLLGAWARGLAVAADVAGGENILPVLLSAYTPGWFAALVVAGAIAAMMSSSDAMLLSGASYLTRDLYRPLVDPGLDSGVETRLGRLGVVGFAVAALGASLWVGGDGIDAGAIGAVLLDIGDIAFGGFAQLVAPVVVALYWSGTTRDGLLMGILLPQAVYLSFNVVPALSVTIPLVGGVSLFAVTYYGWGIAVYGMGLGLVTTVAGSYLTTPGRSERPWQQFKDHTSD